MESEAELIEVDELFDDDDDAGGGAKPDGPQRMDEDSYKAILEQEIHDALGFMGNSSEITRARTQALDYYNGKPFGNEVQGRSQVVLSDVLETIEWILPTLMRIFFSGSRVVRFTPAPGIEADDEQAKAMDGLSTEITDALNYLFKRKCDGFPFMHDWFKAALIEKYQFAKHYVVEKQVREITEKYGLTEEEASSYFDKPDVDVLEAVAQEDTDENGQTIELLDLRCAHKKWVREMVLETVPNEEMLISRHARVLEKARFVGHRIPMTRGDLIALGFPIRVVAEIPSDDTLVSDELAQARRLEEEEIWPGQSSDRTDWSAQPVWVTDCFIRCDRDGDGVEELRRALVAGDGAVLLTDEEVQSISDYWSGITPLPMPHKLIGKSYADLVMDLQLIRSTLLRQILDNTYFVNHSRFAVVDGEVEIDDLLTARPGGVVRMTQPGMVEALPVNPLGPGAFNLLEYLHGVRENRTGVTRYNQGADADSLNQTATGITKIMAAAQVRIDLIARIFAETGVRKMFLAFYKHARQVFARPFTFRSQNQWKRADPSKWPDECEVEIEVGIGTGQGVDQSEALQLLTELQERLFEKYPQLVPPDKVFALSAKIAENAGYTVPDLFFADPAKHPPPPPQPDPEMEKIASHEREVKQRLALEARESVIESHESSQKILLDRMKLDSETEIKKAELASNVAIERAKLAVQREKLTLERDKVALQREQLAHERTEAAREAKKPNKSKGAKK